MSLQEAVVRAFSSKDIADQLVIDKLVKLVNKTQSRDDFDVTVPLNDSTWQKCGGVGDIQLLDHKSASSKLPQHFQVKTWQVLPNRAFLTLERGPFVNWVFKRFKLPRGSKTEMKVINMELEKASNSTNLTSLRCSMVAQIASNLSIFSGAHKSTLKIGSSDRKYLKVDEKDLTCQIGAVVHPDTKKKIVDRTVSQVYDTLFNIQKNILMERSNPDMKSDQFSANDGHLTRANLTFQLMNSNPASSCLMKMEDCKEASFLLYNYTRIIHILRGFKNGPYPKLAEAESIDWSILDENEEWTLIFSYVSEYSRLIQSIGSDLAQGKLAIHRLCQFLIGLSNTFSRFYNRLPVLKEPRPNLLPLIFARIHLVQIVQKVLDHAFSLLQLEPVSNM
ncbi:hypothetical protein TCAL_02864 [Tigriopus californicus]|uniref:DALR anticodon binding domain-containing protein n=2 Tax=Tigriopus californicus TaxID=6832 RepID=A0A553NZ08_TIGCA|nr:hypothetical protein TCAL_02864 [Tigriopus californicus]|eukprot:TCALIF_02864-PA protein Name:"Similar to Dalrd3 DALR anticodon-binding domain-containing protein 3 (Mus musculus)" AED:0.97 eAED:1.00 QI:0/-1/0/1/-1/1/1/0/390